MNTNKSNWLLSKRILNTFGTNRYTIFSQITVDQSAEPFRINLE